MIQRCDAAGRHLCACRTRRQNVPAHNLLLHCLCILFMDCARGQHGHGAKPQWDLRFAFRCIEFETLCMKHIRYGELILFTFQDADIQYHC